MKNLTVFVCIAATFSATVSQASNLCANSTLEDLDRRISETRSELDSKKQNLDMTLERLENLVWAHKKAIKARDFTVSIFPAIPLAGAAAGVGVAVNFVFFDIHVATLGSDILMLYAPAAVGVGGMALTYQWLQNPFDSEVSSKITTDLTEVLSVNNDSMEIELTGSQDVISLVKSHFEMERKAIRKIENTYLSREKASGLFTGQTEDNIDMEIKWLSLSAIARSMEIESKALSDLQEGYQRLCRQGSPNGMLP